MFRAIVRLALHRRGLVVVLAVMFLVYGLYVAAHAKLDVFPEFVQPQVVIQTECPGMSPEQVETLVTTPLESAVSGLSQMESLRSESISGLSIVTAVFAEGSDVFTVRQMLAEKLVEVAGELPAAAKTPKMTPLTSSTMDLLKIGMLSDRLTPIELRRFADVTLEPRLLAVSGVAKASVFGGEVGQFQIQLMPERLSAYGVSISEVLAAARAATGISGAGFVDTPSQRIELQTEGQALTPQELGEVIVAHRHGMSVRLRDVAHMVEAGAPKFGDALIQGKPGVLVTMSSQYGANTLEVTRRLEAALAEMQPVFQKEGIKLYPRLHRPATFIETAMANMRHSLLLGAALVAVVLFVLLASVRTACISLVAIPLSLLTAVVVLDKLGVSINTITLGGLAIALGEVVDDSIIDVENIFRRLRENQTLPAPRPAFNVVLDASIEVRSAVVYATFVVAVMFVPVLALRGLQGRFFAPLALSYVLAIGASLLVALVVTPALSLLFFGRTLGRTEESRVQKKLKAVYGRVLPWVMERPHVVVIAVVVLVLVALTRLSSLGGELLPEFREGHYVLQVSATPGTSLAEMLRIGGQISHAVLAIPGVRTVEQQVGRAELGEDPWGPERSEFHVDLERVGASEEERISSAVRGVLAATPGIQFEVLTFLGDRIGETLTGETAPVVVNIFGNDLDVLDAKAREVADVMRQVPGAADVQIKVPADRPRLAIRLLPERMSQLGFRPVDVLDAVRTAIQGEVVAQVFKSTLAEDVTVLLAPESRRDPETVSLLRLTNTDGRTVTLGKLANVYLTSGRSMIRHEGARRRQTVTCNPHGRDVASFVAQAQKAVRAQVPLAPPVYVEFGGAAEARSQAERELLLNALVAGVAIVILLWLAFGRWRNLLLVLANVPFALVGGVLAAWLTTLAGGTEGLSMGGLVGFVTLFGMTMRNSIMMVSHFDHLVTDEKMPWGRQTAIRGATERLMPIIMTALVTGLGLLPLAVGMREAGREIEGPMAVVILGGLLTSTLLNLLVLPTLALRVGAFGPRPRAE